MIVLLTGILQSKGASAATVDLHGVGVRIYISATTLAHLPPCGRKVTIHTHLLIREDQAALYGFLSEGERDLFTLLLSVSGIGPKGALRILSVAPVGEIRAVIAAGDVEFLEKISGIGKKTAQKLVFELREKIGGPSSVRIPESMRETEDAVEALIALGYRHKEAREAVTSAGAAKGLEEKVRHALKSLGSRGS